MEYELEYWHDASCREVVEREIERLVPRHGLRLSQAVYNLLKAPRGRDTVEVPAGLFGYTLDQRLWVLFDFPHWQIGRDPTPPTQPPRIPGGRLRILKIGLASQAQPEPPSKAVQEAESRHSINAICP
jgi:hypothetical protein